MHNFAVFVCGCALCIAVIVIGLIYPSGRECPAPNASSIEALFAPCQAAASIERRQTAATHVATHISRNDPHDL